MAAPIAGVLMRSSTKVRVGVQQKVQPAAAAALSRVRIVTTTGPALAASSAAITSRLGPDIFMLAARTTAELPSRCMTGIGCRHMSSACSAPAPPAAAKLPEKSESSASLRQSECVIFVHRAGSESAVLKAASDTIVGMLKEEAAIKLKLDAPLDTITLQLAVTDEDGEVTLVPLDGMDTIAEALAKASALLHRDNAPTSTRKLRIVVDEQGEGAPAAAPATGTGGYHWFPDRTDNVDLADPTVVRRKDTCASVFAGLAEQPVRLLRAPPGSGKTSLGQLLVAAAPPGRKVKVLNTNGFVCMGKGTTAEQFWTDQTGEPMAEALNPRQGPVRTYIVDEVQLLYALGADSSFWRAVKQVASTDPRECKVQLLLMGTYGLQPEGNRLLDAAIELRSPWSLKLLLLDEAEVSELFGAFNSTCRAHGYPAVSRSLQLAMERVCGRHVGLLRVALQLFKIAFKGLATVTRDQEAEFAAAQLVFMGRGTDLRALPTGRLMDVPADEVAMLMKVALAGTNGLQLVGTDSDSEVHVPPRLISDGVLDVESESPGPGLPDVLRLRFSSPAMRAHGLFNLGMMIRRRELRLAASLPVSALSDPADFVRAAVKRMSSSELAGSLSEAGSSDAANLKGDADAAKTSESLLERQYQMSFYSAALALLPAGFFMSLDFGLVYEATMQRRGYIDFFIIAGGFHRIGIELTRDGKELKGNISRFDAKTSSYVSLNLDSWVVVDFRQARPRTKGKAGTVFVVFDAGFKSATIMQARRKDEHIVLMT